LKRKKVLALEKYEELEKLPRQKGNIFRICFNDIKSKKIDIGEKGGRGGTEDNLFPSIPSHTIHHPPLCIPGTVQPANVHKLVITVE
jgi:hypothetical protein